MNDSLMTPQQVAEMLNVKLSTVYHWSHVEYIPTVRMGKLIRFRRVSILRWVDRKESKGRTRRIPPRLDF